MANGVSQSCSRALAVYVSATCRWHGAHLTDNVGDAGCTSVFSCKMCMRDLTKTACAPHVLARSMALKLWCATSKEK